LKIADVNARKHRDPQGDIEALSVKYIKLIKTV